MKGGSPGARVLRYASSAAGLLESLPLGNGALGALPDGGLPAETIAINHDTLWSGTPGYRDNPAAAQHLPAIRRAASAGDYRAADKLARIVTLRLSSPHDVGMSLSTDTMPRP